MYFVSAGSDLYLAGYFTTFYLKLLYAYEVSVFAN